MAIDSGTMNLTDFALLSVTPKKQAEVAYSMIKAGSVFRDIPLETDPILNMDWIRYVGGLQGPTWAPLNTDPTSVKAVPTPYNEQAYAFANMINIPILLLKARNRRGNPFNEQTDNFLKALSYDLNYKFFENHHGTGGDPNSFVGIRERLRDTAKFGTNSECKVNAGVSYADADLSTAANTNKLLRKIQEVLDAMGENEGDGIIIYGNEDILRRLENGVRTLGAGGGFDMTQDAFGRKVRKYRNATIRSAGRQNPTAAGVQSQVLVSTEDANGALGGTTYTSLFFVKAGKESFHGWQFMALEPTDPFKTDDGVTMRVVLHNAYGLVQHDTRALGQLYGIATA